MNDFNSFAIIGNKFYNKNMKNIEYKIIDIDKSNGKISIETDSFGGRIFVLNLSEAEDSFNIGLWIPILNDDNIQNGMNCSKCNKFNDFAAPNQDDGTYKCWSCRNGF